ncbi:ATP/GTP-binding protein [Salmonella enterica]
MKNDYKILFIGRTGVGKTTAINTVSQSKVIATDVAMTSGGSAQKITTTVGLDYGEFTAKHLSENYLMRLYGVPGQDRFSYSWEILQKGCSGIILLADATHKFLLEDIIYYNEMMSRNEYSVPMIIAIMKHDELEIPQLNKLKQTIQAQKSKSPILWIDARDADTVVTVLYKLLRMITGSGV